MSSVLIIDDDHFVRQGLRELLEMAGYSVLEAENGQVGIDIFNDHIDKTSVVILDLSMPVMDGGETYQEMIKICPDIPVLLTSGYRETITELIALRDPAHTAFLLKPFDIDLLLTKIKAFINGSEVEAETSCTQVIH